MVKNSNTHFLTKIYLDSQGYSKRKFKVGRKYVKLRMDETSKTIYIVEAKTHAILETKKYKGKNANAFKRAGKVLLMRYIGSVFPKIRRPHKKGNVSKDWIIE